MVIVHSFLYVYQRVYGMDWYDGYDMDFKVVYDESCFKATVEGAVRSVFSFFHEIHLWILITISWDMWPHSYDYNPTILIILILSTP